MKSGQRIDDFLDNFLDDIFVGVSSGVATAHLMDNLSVMEAVKLIIILFTGLTIVGMSFKRLNSYLNDQL